MSTRPVTFPLTPGYRGFFAGVVNSGPQQVLLEVLNAQGGVLTSATFRGKGMRVHLSDIINSRQHMSFGPFDFNANIRVTISNSNDGGNNYVTSKMVGPLTINKAPEPDFPMEVISTTIVSEDGGDVDHDDATVTILQYK